MYPKKIHKIALIGNKRLNEHLDLVKNIHQFLSEKKLEIYVDEIVAKALPSKDFKYIELSHHKLTQETDLLVVMGGDGTLLKVAGSLSKKDIYCYGINFGTLGFFAESQPHEALDGLTKILNGDFIVDERSLLKVEVMREGQLTDQGIALNEVVINQGIKARIIQLDIAVGQEHINTYRSDGLIISTPSGSTGHSISAGGPIVHPDLNAFIITPICSFSLSNRPIVIPTPKGLCVTVETFREYHERIALTLDGQTTFSLEYGDKIRVNEAEVKLALVRLKPHQYYETLREKLRWG